MMDSTASELSLPGRIQGSLKLALGGGTWHFLVVAAVALLPLPEEIGRVLAGAIIATLGIRFAFSYRSFPDHHRYQVEMLPREKQLRAVRDRVYGPVTELARLLHPRSATDLNIPERYRSAILTLIQQHHWAIGEDFNPEALTTFDERDRKRLEGWVREYPECVFTLLLALAAGWEEPQAWGLAMNV